MNELKQKDNKLVNVDYSDLLEKILKVLKTSTIFSIKERRRILINLDEIANQIANLEINNPLGTSEFKARVATVNFSPSVQEKFNTQIQKIRDCLQVQLEAGLEKNESITEFISNLGIPLHNFTGAITTKLNFQYPFNIPYSNLIKQQLSLTSYDNKNDSILKFHKLIITVKDASAFKTNLQQSLKNYINNLSINDEEKEELYPIFEDTIADNNGEFEKLIKLVDTESLGKLKKEAKIIYLEYILANIGNANPQGIIYLQDLIRRLKLIEEYINLSDKSINDYDAIYAGSKVNYKDLFSRAEVLDALPIIPIIVGNLEESTDHTTGDRQFIFGLKLKLNNQAQAHGGKNAFDYYLNLLNPDSEEHKNELNENQFFGRKVLKIVFLYYFVFACNPKIEGYTAKDDLNYNPITTFEKVLRILQAEDEEAKKDIFRRIKRGFEEYKIREKITILATILRDFVKRTHRLETARYTRYIGVKRGILERNPNQILNGHLFNEVLHRPKEALKYISISDLTFNGSALCQMSVNFSIEDIRYFTTENQQQFSMAYDIKDINILPVLWTPKDNRCREIYEKNLQQHNLIVFYYDNQRLSPQNGLNRSQVFIYKVTFSLLSYICLQILLKNTPDNLFIPQMRMHVGDENNPSHSEEFIAILSKALSHLLKESKLSNSQGCRVHKALDTNKLRNTLSSLYSVLPKKFVFANAVDTPQLERLAIIVVSSRECEAVNKNPNRQQRKANLLGEVISIKRQENHSIKIEALQTFSDNYSVESLYTKPSILKDTIHKLYIQGYRHFLYIAQTPYSSTLHITRNEQDEGLFFMSPNLLNFLNSDYADIKIYPIFFDKYYVHKLKNLQMSLYIQNPKELINLAEDINQKMVLFFNLFNGKQVGYGDARFYNGVIAYSTLLNIYPGVLDDQHIRQALIDDTQLKNDILQYLTLFHFARYEAVQKISLKLDPYQQIIGDESIGAKSLFYHINGKVEFNLLAFLTQVKKVLNV